MTTYGPDSLTGRAAAAVNKRGASTAKELAADLPGLTVVQITSALTNATHHKLVRLKVRGNAKAKRCSVWEPVPVGGRFIEQRPPNSAWELAHGRQIAGEWPPAFENARRFNLLGPWNEEATNDNHRSAAA